MKICTIDGCGREHEGHGYCQRHLLRWKKYGDPQYAKGSRGEDEARFWSWVDKSGPCWLWTGGLDEWDYGKFSFRGRSHKAHLWIYERKIGPVPAGMVLDHVKERGCENKHCVNYENHLEPVQQRENVLRGRLTKLSDDEVERLYARYLAKEKNQRELALEAGVHQSSLSVRFKRLAVELAARPTKG